MALDLEGIANNWPFWAALGAAWVRLETALGKNRGEIEAMKEASTKERAEWRTDVKDLQADVKSLLVNQAKLVEREAAIHEALKRLVDK